MGDLIFLPGRQLRKGLARRGIVKNGIVAEASLPVSLPQKLPVGLSSGLDHPSIGIDQGNDRNKLGLALPIRHLLRILQQEQSTDFDADLQKLICQALTEHRRIIFNGNGYDKSWVQEAERRGLSNLRTTAECLPAYISQKNIDLVTRHGIFTETEFRARYEIHLESYCKLLHIEAMTMTDMIRRQILPAASSYAATLCRTIAAKEGASVSCPG